jgi:hypothetical protein
MQIETANWSGDGNFTVALVEALKQVESIALLRVEDAPAGRAESGYNLLANEVFVGFRLRRVIVFGRLAGLPLPRVATRPDMTLSELGERLARVDGIGAADYADRKMLQYLRTERVIQPYQTRGYKLVELVRVYEMTAVFPA